MPHTHPSCVSKPYRISTKLFNLFLVFSYEWLILLWRPYGSGDDDDDIETADADDNDNDEAADSVAKSDRNGAKSIKTDDSFNLTIRFFLEFQLCWVEHGSSPTHWEACSGVTPTTAQIWTTSRKELHRVLTCWRHGFDSRHCTAAAEYGLEVLRLVAWHASHRINRGTNAS